MQANGPFQFQHRSDFFLGVHNEALPVVPMCVSNEERSPFAIHGSNTAASPTSPAEVIRYDFPVPFHRPVILSFCSLHSNDKVL
jgi:hypothetical protein